MNSQSRNLLLFFEENEDKNNISSNLVRLYMNQFVIDEEDRYEIIGAFNLSKVFHSGRYPKFYYRLAWDRAWKEKLDVMFKSNWDKDKQIIETTLNQTNVFTKQHIRTHIIIGTSLYMDHFRESFETFIPKWNSRIRKNFRGLTNTESAYDKMDKVMSLNQLTLLNGWKTIFATKDHVRQAYFESKRNIDAEDTGLLKPPLSVNDDLENMTSRIFRPHKKFGDGRENVETFLFEMLSDDEIEKQQSNEFQFMRSDCERLTVALY